MPRPIICAVNVTDASYLVRYFQKEIDYLQLTMTDTAVAATLLGVAELTCVWDSA